MFTRVFAHLAQWTTERRIFGIYAEATAAHPYSQQASLPSGRTRVASCSHGYRRSPSALHRGEIVRYQALSDGVDVSAADLSVASDHGRELLDYVLGDLP